MKMSQNSFDNNIQKVIITKHFSNNGNNKSHVDYKLLTCKVL